MKMRVQNIPNACRRQESASDPSWTGSPELCAALQEPPADPGIANTLLLSVPHPCVCLWAGGCRGAGQSTPSPRLFPKVLEADVGLPRIELESSRCSPNPPFGWNLYSTGQQFLTPWTAQGAVPALSQSPHGTSPRYHCPGSAGAVIITPFPFIPEENCGIKMMLFATGSRTHHTSAHQPKTGSDFLKGSSWVWWFFLLLCILGGGW